MNKVDAINVEAQRCHLFAELAESATTEELRRYYEHRSHMAYLAMRRLETDHG